MVKKKVSKIFDGDSGKFSDGRHFRLARVGSPEKHQFGGEKATRTLAGMIARSNGWVDWNAAGKSYGREVGNMSNKDGPINKRMRDRGYINKGR